MREEQPTDSAVSKTPTLRVAGEDEATASLVGAWAILEPLGLPLPNDQSGEVTTRLAEYWHTQGLRYDMTTRCFHRGKQTLLPDTMAEYAWRHYGCTPQIAAWKSAMDALVARHEEHENRILLSRLTAPVACRPAASAELEKLVDLLVPGDCEPDRRAYYLAAVRQIMWQVKRRMLGESTQSSDLMIILTGGQGIGKSTVVREFIKPLQWLATQAGSFDLFRDKFRLHELNWRYLVVLDELEGAVRADMTAIKAVVTAEMIEARIMRAQRLAVLRRNASFIGTSNTSVRHVLKDSTGMRRFVEIECRRDPIDFAALRLLNFDLLWQAETGEDRSPPINAIPHALRQSLQDELRQLSLVEQWAAECIKEEPTATVYLKEAHANICRWCETLKLKPPSQTKLARDLHALFPDHYRRGNGNVSQLDGLELVE